MRDVYDNGRRRAGMEHGFHLCDVAVGDAEVGEESDDSWYGVRHVLSGHDARYPLSDSAFGQRTSDCGHLGDNRQPHALPARLLDDGLRHGGEGLAGRRVRVLQHDELPFVSVLGHLGLQRDLTQQRHL